ncbi:MAG: M15 family metallopeptidase [Acidimicrobiia bacterium]|nr:M15 family metallopeptidase [Acidimicrobiia bacterium]
MGADGNPEVLPTPPPLVDRQLPTVDLLPPPADGAFHASVEPIDAATRDRMGATWHEGCPVGLADLRHVTLSFVGFDGRDHTGELVVAASVADDLVSVFHRLFDARFPVEEMRLPTTADLTAPATGDGDDTAAFVCRNVRGGTHWSSHARGLAIDLDPFQNPYSSGSRVIPELASAYLDRGEVRPGMIEPGDVVTKAFASIGWTWGGSWRDPVDRQHFSADGH